MATHATARLDEIEVLADGPSRYRPVRHHFGITSFGATGWVGAEEGDLIINEYDEESEPAEELFVVVSGRATFDVEGETIDATPGTLVYTGPGTDRKAVAVEPGTTILVVGGAPGKVYDATGWELWAPLRPLYDQGDYEELTARLRELIERAPQYPMLVYNLACSESLRGDRASAIEHLRRAVAGSEKHRADARQDADFDAIRDDPAFQELIGVSEERG
jgi:tetratricopeptide (TPR) repeat protein